MSATQLGDLRNHEDENQIEEELDRGDAGGLSCAEAVMVSSGAPFLSRISSTVCYRPKAAIGRRDDGQQGTFY